MIRKRGSGLHVQVYAGRDPLTGRKRWVSRQVPGQTKASYRQATNPTTPSTRTGPPACWSPPWNTPGRPSAPATPTCPTRCWWWPPGRRASGSTGAISPHRWQVNGADRHEVLIGGEGLQRGALEVLGTLLHEAAHGLAQARNVQATSCGGRYHNRL